MYDGMACGQYSAIFRTCPSFFRSRSKILSLNPQQPAANSCHPLGSSARPNASPVSHSDTPTVSHPDASLPDASCAPLPDAPSAPRPDTSINEADSEVVEELQAWNPMEEEWGSHRNVYGCDVDDAGVAIDGFVAEQTPVCKYFEVGAVAKPLGVF